MSTTPLADTVFDATAFSNSVFDTWLEKADKERNQNWDSLEAKDKRETYSYLNTSKGYKKRLYESLYDTYFEFVGDEKLTAADFYDALKKVIKEEITRTSTELRYATELQKFFPKENTEPPKEFVF